MKVVERCCSPAPSEAVQAPLARKLLENHAIEASGATAVGFRRSRDFILIGKEAI
jgi:hypothetical protein